MRRALLAAAIVALAGCPGLKRHSLRNAPGKLDIQVPPARLTMDPQQDIPEDPGVNQLGIAPGLSVMPGIGRMYGDGNREGSLELGVKVHVAFGESADSGGKGALGFPRDGWGATLGWGIAQFGFSDTSFPEQAGTPTVMGPITLEATRHWFYMLNVSGGLVLYPTPGAVGDGSERGVDAGGQLSAGAGPFAIKMRYVQDSGFEIFGGYQLYLPAALTWSR